MNQVLKFTKNTLVVTTETFRHAQFLAEAYFSYAITSYYIMIPKMFFPTISPQPLLSQQTTDKGEYGHPLAALLSETVHFRFTVHTQLYSCTRERESSCTAYGCAHKD